MDIHFANVARAEISVGLRGEGVGSAGVVGSFCLQRGGGDNGKISRVKDRGQKNYRDQTYNNWCSHFRLLTDGREENRRPKFVDFANPGNCRFPAP